MGQDLSVEEKTQNFKQFLLQYSQEQEYLHPQFETVKVYTHIQTNELICLKQFYLKNEIELQEMIENIGKRSKFEQNNLLKILSIVKQDCNKICSNQTILTVALQCYKDNLQDEIIIRKKTNSPYQESHIWLLLQQIIDSCAYLEERKYYHGDIKPLTIYLDEFGQVKLVDCSMLPKMQNGFQKMIQSKDKSYLSPLLLKQYHDLILNPIHNPFKSDVYSFGLTILSVLLIQEVYDCYDFVNGAILIDVIDIKISKVISMGYSPLLCQFIRQLLIFDENERPSWIQLKEYIDKFRDKILNMIPFYSQQFSLQHSNKSPMRKYIPLICSPTRKSFHNHQPQNSQQFGNKPKYVHISKENY